jgi:phosphosulfolactate phosphohydrolase-like enzyme
VRIDRICPAHLAGETLDVAVVIDVLRATTTALVWLDRVTELAVVSEPELLPLFHDRQWLVVSELERAATFGPRVDNSPALAETVPLDGKTPCLVTTNGTRALCAAAACAERVLVLGFVNLTATARLLERLRPSRLTLLPAGDFARATPHAEDERCADALVALLSGTSVDPSALAESARRDERVQRRIAREVSLARDVEVALSIDRHPVAAEFHAAGTAAGWIRRCE